MLYEKLYYIEEAIKIGVIAIVVTIVISTLMICLFKYWIAKKYLATMENNK